MGDIARDLTMGPYGRIIPIPLREGLTAYIAGLPFDLTPDEAEKIARVVIAMSAETNLENSECPST